MKLRISSLSVSDLDNTGSLLDKQDPAVKLTLGSSTYETSRYRSLIMSDFDYWSSNSVNLCTIYMDVHV